MKQPPPLPPQTLNYASPSSSGSIRKKAASHARSNGGGCIFFSTCFGLSFLGTSGAALQGAGPLAFVVAAVLGLHSLAFLCCGMLYIVAGYKIKLPNLQWETILTTTATIHVIIVASITCLVLISVATAGSNPAGTVTGSIGAFFNLIILISLIQMILLVRKMQRLGE